MRLVLGHSHAGICRPSGAARSHLRQHSRTRTRPIRFHPAAISGAGQAHRDAVQSFSAHQMPVSRRRRTASCIPHKLTRRAVEKLPRRSGPLPHPNRQSGSRPGVSMGLRHRQRPEVARFTVGKHRQTLESKLNICASPASAAHKRSSCARRVFAGNDKAEKTVRRAAGIFQKRRINSRRQQMFF